MRHAGHLNLDGDRDLLFHLLRRAARPLRNDRDVVVGDVWIGFDRQVVERDGPPASQQDGNGQHDKFIVQRKIYEGSNHSLSCFVCRCPCLTALRRPLIWKPHSRGWTMIAIRYWASTWSKTSAFVTTCCPGLTPGL